MKSIDFTHAGGFPLTQDELNYLQQAYTECVNALATLGGDGTTPVIISGMVISTPSAGTTAVTDGWFFYNGEMIKFTGASVTPTGSNVPLVSITLVSTNLTYNDGSIYPAVLNKTATLISGASATTSTQFPLSTIQPFQLTFGINGRETGWNSALVNTPAGSGGVFGTLYYKKNVLTNTLQIKGSFDVNNAQNLSASPGALNITFATLPAAYWPGGTIPAYFTTYYFAANMFKDDLGVAWVKQMTSVVNSAGQVMVNLIKPDSGIPAYTVIFNTIIPLD